jgi:hypothetical protein
VLEQHVLEDPVENRGRERQRFGSPSLETDVLYTRTSRPGWPDTPVRLKHTPPLREAKDQLEPTGDRS